VNKNYTDTGTPEDKKNRDTGTIKGHRGQTFFKGDFLQRALSLISTIRFIRSRWLRVPPIIL
jgi:hypothetical protein